MHDISHILLLGDVKGTKAALGNEKSTSTALLEDRLFIINSAFAQTFLKFKNRSHAMWATTFSDSVLVDWKDVIEGQKYAVPFALQFWNNLRDLQSIYRIFIDTGPYSAATEPISEVLRISNPRFTSAFPVSVAAWSVFIAEESHFPAGIFIGKQLQQLINKYRLSGEIFTAGKFSYNALDISAHPIDRSDPQ